jgi:hypothetical protein
VVDIFTALLGIVSVCALFGAVTRIVCRPPKVWHEDWSYEENEELADCNKIRKVNPHIWME